MNKILVPIDFSKTSLNAMSYSIKLFGASELEITVLHACEMSSNAFHMKSMDSILEKEARREMETLIKKVYDEKPDIVLKTKIMKGDAVSVITSLGNSGAYDFIVMGTKGASGLKEVFIGSVAGSVISKTQAPVLIVPDNYLYRPLNEIVFAISGIPLSSASVVEPLRKLAMLHPCKVNVLHVTEGKKLDLEEVLSTIEDLDPSVVYAFGAGNINESLNDYLTKGDAELLCLIRSKKDFFSRILDDSSLPKQAPKPRKEKNQAHSRRPAGGKKDGGGGGILGPARQFVVIRRNQVGEVFQSSIKRLGGKNHGDGKGEEAPFHSGQGKHAAQNKRKHGQQQMDAGVGLSAEEVGYPLKSVLEALKAAFYHDGSRFSFITI